MKPGTGIPTGDTEAERALRIEYGGRRIKFWTALAYATGSALLPLAAWLDDSPWAKPDGSWSVPTSVNFRALLGFSVALWLLAFVRWLALRSFGNSNFDALVQAASSRDHEEDARSPDRGDEKLVITCSGGGIKSASFCLGALQRLNEIGVYERAHTVVGVSGGGYTAGAYAYRTLKAHSPTAVYGVDSPELAQLRTRTDYLASSRRARLDLVLSILYGVALNMLLVGAVLTVVALVVVAQIGPENNGWSWWPALLIPGATMLVLFGFFIRAQVGITRRRRSKRPSPAVATDQQQADQERADKLLRREWASNIPNRLLIVAVTLAAVYPGVPLTIARLDDPNTFIHFDSTESTLTFAGIYTVTTAGVFTAMVRSARKIFETGESGTRPNRFLLFFRQQLAPRIGVTVAFLGAFVALVLLTFWFRSFDPAQKRLCLLLAGAAVTIVFVAQSTTLTSLFPFYLDRLRYAFFSMEAGASPAPVVARGSVIVGRTVPTVTPGAQPAVEYEVPNFTDMRDRLRPRLVLCATANVKDGSILPSGRNGTPFIFASRMGFAADGLPGGACLPPAREFEDDRELADDRELEDDRKLEDDSAGKRRGRRRTKSTESVDLAKAVAISGAAIAPIAGREKTIRSYRLLLALANVRLGVWLRNPYWTFGPGREAKGVIALDAWLDRALPFKAVQEAVGQLSIYSPYIYVTDGGHYDNLGLVESLRQRPDLIVLLDGSGDPEDEFPAMGDAIATARMDLGVEIRFDPTPLQRGHRQHPPRGWTTATATYPEPAPGGKRHECTIVYIKCVLPAGLSWDLESYRKRNPGFPVDSAKFELYDEFDFEAYRVLGDRLVTDAFRPIGPAEIGGGHWRRLAELLRSVRPGSLDRR